MWLYQMQLFHKRKKDLLPNSSLPTLQHPFCNLHNAHGDTIMLKTLKLPTVDEFDAMLKEAQSWAASVGYKEEDVNDIIKSYRKEKRGQA